MELLKKLCDIHAPSGEEFKVKNFVLDYIESNQNEWKTIPKVYHGDGFQDCIVLVFGKPKTAIFAHMDSIGFTAKYNNELVKIGGPVCIDGTILIGEDSKGKFESVLKIENDKMIAHGREIDRGTSLTFKPNFREDDEFIQCCYLDNRLGVWNALKVAETLENGIICFSSWEEHGGGSVGYLSKFIYENFQVKNALISDITWVT